MIKGLQGTCGVTVSAGNTSLPYISPNNNNPIQGMLRINGTEIEVFNGTGWQLISSSYATVTLDQDIIDVIQWARKKRDEDFELEHLAKENVAIQDLVNQIKEKKDQIKMVHILTKKESEKSIEWATAPYGSS
jgi:hypothetical protein